MGKETRMGLYKEPQQVQHSRFIRFDLLESRELLEVIAEEQPLDGPRGCRTLTLTFTPIPLSSHPMFFLPQFFNLPTSPTSAMTAETATTRNRDTGATAPARCRQCQPSAYFLCLGDSHGNSTRRFEPPTPAEHTTTATSSPPSPFSLSRSACVCP